MSIDYERSPSGKKLIYRDWKREREKKRKNWTSSDIYEWIMKLFIHFVFSLSIKLTYSTTYFYEKATKSKVKRLKVSDSFTILTLFIAFHTSSTRVTSKQKLETKSYMWTDFCTGNHAIFKLIINTHTHITRIRYTHKHAFIKKNKKL